MSGQRKRGAPAQPRAKCPSCGKIGLGNTYRGGNPPRAYRQCSYCSEIAFLDVMAGREHIAKLAEDDGELIFAREVRAGAWDHRSDVANAISNARKGLSA